MKMRLMFPLLLISSLYLQGCDSSEGLLDDKESTDHIVPERPEPGDPNRPRPSEDAPVITSDEHTVYDVSGEPILFRGINLEYGGEVEFNKSLGIDAVGVVGSNVVRLLLNEETTADTLESALQQVMNANLVAILSLNGPDGEPFCADDRETLTGAVKDLWLGRWLRVLVQDRFQPHIMFNLARGWGPVGINNAQSSGYAGFLANYKEAIRDIRKAGFKVPLVIDAPGCGEDFNAFLGDRARELRTADTAGNLVLSLSAYGGLWNSAEKLAANIAALSNESAPFFFAEIGGSGSSGDASVDHLLLMQKGAGDLALTLDIPWATTNDAAAYTFTLPTPFDTTGATYSYDLYLPRQYQTEGNLTAQLYIVDTNGVAAGIGGVVARELRADTWNRVRVKLDSMDNLFHLDSAVTEPVAIDASSISKVGIRFLASGKPTSVSQVLKVDNLRVSIGGASRYVYEENFSTDLGGWAFNGGASATLAQNNGALNMQPDWTSADNILLRVDGIGAHGIDFTNELTIETRVLIPEDYQLGSVYFKFFGQFSDAYTWVPTPDKIAADFIPGEWSDLSFTVNFSDSADVSDIKVFGLQLGGLSGSGAEPILIDYVRIADASQGTPTGAKYSTTFSEGSAGWGNIGDAEKIPSPLTVEDGVGVVVLNGGAGSQLDLGTTDIFFDNTVNLRGSLSVRADIYLSEEFTNATTMWFQFFLQDGSSWVWSNTEGAGIAQFTPGAWTTIELPFSVLGEGTDREMAPHQLGMQFGNLNGLSGIIRIDNIQLLGEVEDSGTVNLIELAFEDEEEFAGITPDMTSGRSSLTEGALVSAKQHDFGISPFGWLAWSWHGNNGDRAVLNLSTEESFEDAVQQTVSLTQRGLEIIEGPNGIAETAEPVNFPAVAE